MNILIRRHGGLGDELCLTPSYRAIKSEYPNTNVYVSGNSAADILLGNPNISGAYHTNDRVDIPIDKVYDIKWFRDLHYGYDMHLVDFYASQLDIEVDSHVLDYYISDSDLRGTDWVEELPRPIICYNNDGGWRSREPMIELVASMLAEEYTIMQVGSGKPYAGVGYNLVNMVSLRELAAILSRVDLYVGADSGIFHLASAVGCRSVIWFTSVDPVYRVHTGNDIGLHSNKCHGCYSKDTEEILIGGWCPNGTFECLRIDTDMILDAINRCIGGS